AAERTRTEQVHVVLGLDVGDDGDGREGVHVNAVAEVVIVVEVCIQYEGNGLVSPLANLRDVLASGRRQKATVDNQHLPLANDHGGVAACVLPVLDLVDAFGEPGNFALVLRSGKREEK